MYWYGKTFINIKVPLYQKEFIMHHVMEMLKNKSYCIGFTMMCVFRCESSMVEKIIIGKKQIKMDNGDKWEFVCKSSFQRIRFYFFVVIKK